MKRWKIALTLGLVCFILTIAISIQLKTIDDTNSTVSQTLNSNSLRDQVLKWKEKYDKATKELEVSEKQLEDARQQAIQKDANSAQIAEEIQLDNVMLGLTDVTGSGLIITLKDNDTVTRNSISPFDNIEKYLVHAVDLIEVVNALKNAGAEAISINDQRITNYSAIYCAGNVIVVNGQKIGSPLEIKAIGSPELLYGSLSIPGGYIELLRDTGVIVDMKKSDNITINKFDGIMKSNYMKNVN